MHGMIDFYKGKKVFITGHTGFKGSWFIRILLHMGARLCGYSLGVPTSPSLFNLLNLENEIDNVEGDVTDLEKLTTVIKKFNPDLVFHFAAQPIVRQSYIDPVSTYKTNVMGTVNILEAIRSLNNVGSFVNVTTDKVYLNKEWVWGYREDEVLDGFDPYSNSKSCSELVTHCYINSFFRDLPISTVRSGNVIGGGDFAVDRIIPDCFRSIADKENIIVRNPFSVRPYQHVLEALNAYLLVAFSQYNDNKKSGAFNVGPDDCDCVTTGQLVSKFCNYWGNGVSWESSYDEFAPHEATFLKLDCSKIKSTLNWHPQWHIDTSLQKTADWYKTYLYERNITNITDFQIKDYFDNEQKNSSSIRG